MAASFEGHVDIVRMLIDANVKIDMQEEVCHVYHRKRHINVTVESSTR